MNIGWDLMEVKIFPIIDHLCYKEKVKGLLQLEKVIASKDYLLL